MKRNSGSEGSRANAAVDGFGGPELGLARDSWLAQIKIGYTSAYGKRVFQHTCCFINRFAVEDGHDSLLYA